MVTFWVMRHFLFCKVRQELAWTFVIQLRFLGVTKLSEEGNRIEGHEDLSLRLIVGELFEGLIQKKSILNLGSSRNIPRDVA
jgi:hypothetical protein